MRTAIGLLSHGSRSRSPNSPRPPVSTLADLADAPAGQDIEYDDEHRIVGWGLTLIPTPHTFVVDGHRLYTWCAADTLMFPAIIGRPAHVESRLSDNGYGRPPDRRPAGGVTDLSPATAVISIPASDELDVSRVRASCCNPGRFFASAEAAEDWLAQYPTGTVLPVADAYPHLQPIAARLLG